MQLEFSRFECDQSGKEIGILTNIIQSESGSRWIDFTIPLCKNIGVLTIRLPIKKCQGEESP
jgi:hypothetical protein